MEEFSKKMTYVLDAKKLRAKLTNERMAYKNRRQKTLSNFGIDPSAA